MTAYYNENDPAAAHCIRALMADGVIAPGVVDDRSITEVQPDDLRGFKQCHLFAGGALWQLALRQAGWPDDRPVWTGSCPCQPFSAAGKHEGTDDPRHLWPHLHRLISAVRPPIVMGEQVSGKAGYGWLDGVCDDLEAEGYTCGAADIAACAIDAPHQRSRLWWYAELANTNNLRSSSKNKTSAKLAESKARQNNNGLFERSDSTGDRDSEMAKFNGRAGTGRIDRAKAGNAHGSTPNTVGIKQTKGIETQRTGQQSVDQSDAQVLANTSSQPRQQNTRSTSGNEGAHGWRSQNDNRHSSGDESGVGDVANAEGLEQRRGRQLQSQSGNERNQQGVKCSPTTPNVCNSSYWGSHWIECYDGKARRTEPSICFLADGLQLPVDAIGSESTADLQETFPKNRIEAWRIAGNAIVPQLAVEFIWSISGD